MFHSSLQTIWIEKMLLWQHVSSISSKSSGKHVLLIEVKDFNYLKIIWLLLTDINFLLTLHSVNQIWRFYWALSQVRILQGALVNCLVVLELLQLPKFFYLLQTTKEREGRAIFSSAKWLPNSKLWATAGDPVSIHQY